MLRKTAEIEGVGSSDEYQRLYFPSKLTDDSQYPFDAGDGVRIENVTTSCDRRAIVILPETLEVNRDETDIEVRRSSTERQLDLTEVSEK